MPSRQFLSFIAIGVLNNGFCYLLFVLFVTLGMHYALAALASSIAGILVNFQVTGSIVFGNSDQRLIFKYFGVYALIYVLNVALLRLLANSGIDVRLGSALLLPFLALLAFSLNKWFVFRTPDRVKTIPETADNANREVKAS